jgi:hypothetical protein
MARKRRLMAREREIRPRGRRNVVQKVEALTKLDLGLTWGNETSRDVQNGWHRCPMRCKLELVCTDTACIKRRSARLWLCAAIAQRNIDPWLVGSTLPAVLSTAPSSPR